MPVALEKTFSISSSREDERDAFLREGLTSLGADAASADALPSVISRLFARWAQTAPDAEASLRLCKRPWGVKVTVSLKGERLGAPSSARHTGHAAHARSRPPIGEPVYSYSDGVNKWSVTARKKKGNPYLKNAVAVALALILGLLPIGADVRAAALDGYIAPIFNAVLSMLKLFIGIVVFLSVVDGILMLGDMRRLKSAGKDALKDFGRNSLLVAAVTFLTAVLCFGAGGRSAGADGELQTILKLLLSLIPSDVVAPLSSGNVLQILIIALLMGVVILSLGKKLTALPAVVDDLQSVFMRVMTLIGGVMPLFVFLSVLKLLFEGGFDKLRVAAYAYMWFAAVGVLNLLFNLARTSRLSGIKCGSLLKRISGSVLIGVITSSSALSFSENLDAMRSKLGVSESRARFLLPIGSLFYRPSIIPMLVFATLMAAGGAGMSFSVTDTALLTLTAALMSVALPPVSGGAISCYALLFSQFGVPSGAIAALVSLNIFFGALQTGLDNGTLLLRVCALERKSEATEKEEQDAQ